MKAVRASLRALKLAGVHGVAVEVWWGVVECFSPMIYDWSLYEALFRLISEAGLKLHAALSFHSDTRWTVKGKEGVSLPLWIMEVGSSMPGLFLIESLKQRRFSGDLHTIRINFYNLKAVFLQFDLVLLSLC